MRIFYTADTLIPVPPIRYGGVERVISGLITELRGRGHVIGLMALAESTEQVNTLCPWPRPTWRSRMDTLQNALALQKMVRSFRPDVVHSFSRIEYLLPLLFHRVPKVMTYGYDPPLYWKYRISRGNLAHIARGSLFFTAPSDHIVARGRRGGGVSHTVYNFIDPKKWTFVPEVSHDAPLVFLSRIEPFKGCHTAIAIAKASKRRLLIAGNRVEQGNSAGYWDREIAPHLGRDGIEYVGEVNDEQKNDLLGSAAALVVPIDCEEAFGIVFAEALACGTPVITCPRGGAPEVVKNGVHGFHIRSIQEGVEAVEKLSTICRRTCREDVEQRFALNLIADQYLELYKSCLRLV